MEEEATRRYQEYLASNIAQSQAAATVVTTTATGQETHYDREEHRMHEKRAKVLSRGRKFALGILIMSVISVVLGIPGVFLAEQWPHLSGGGIVMGVLCVPSALWYMYMHHYHVRRMGERTRYMVDRKFHFLVVFSVFLVLVGFLGQVYGMMSMAWSVEECRAKLIKSCKPDEHANTLLALGACLVTLTVFLFFAMYCMCDTVVGHLEEFSLRPGIRGYQSHHAYEYSLNNKGQLPYETALQESMPRYGTNRQRRVHDSDSSDEDTCAQRPITTDSVLIQDMTSRTMASPESHNASSQQASGMALTDDYHPSPTPSRTVTTV